MASHKTKVRLSRNTLSSFILSKSSAPLIYSCRHLVIYCRPLPNCEAVISSSPLFQSKSPRLQVSRRNIRNFNHENIHTNPAADRRSFATNQHVASTSAYTSVAAIIITNGIIANFVSWPVCSAAIANKFSCGNCFNLRNFRFQVSAGLRLNPSPIFLHMT